MQVALESSLLVISEHDSALPYPPAKSSFTRCSDFRLLLEMRIIWRIPASTSLCCAYNVRCDYWEQERDDDSWKVIAP